MTILDKKMKLKRDIEARFKSLISNCVTSSQAGESDKPESQEVTKLKAWNLMEDDGNTCTANIITDYVKGKVAAYVTLNLNGEIKHHEIIR